MLAALREPPPKGSLRESVLLLYMLKKEEREYTRDLALVQMQVDKEKGIERFNEYRKTMFPWIEGAKKREKEVHSDILKRVVAAGPLLVTSKDSKTIKSRLVTRLEKHQQGSTITSSQRKKQDQFLKKIGKAIPT